jgi:predicted ArsR family transcriptional regulator
MTLLRTRDRTIPELARELSVSTNAVRGHLAALGRDGLVAGGESRRRDSPGKPPTLYGLTPAAEELFPRGYGALLLGVLDLLREWDGDDAPVDVMRAAGARGADGEGPEAAARALAALGAEVSLDAVGGATILSTTGCPLAAVVLERPELCGWVSALLAGACGGSAAERCERSGGRPRCRFTLTLKDSADS